MEYFSLFGIMAFVMWIANSNKVSRLAKKVKKLDKKNKGESTMSRLISNLVGQKAVIQLEDDLGDSKWTIIDTDEEWLHLSRTNRKGSEINKYVHVDDVKSIQTTVSK